MKQIPPGTTRDVLKDFRNRAYALQTLIAMSSDEEQERVSPVTNLVDDAVLIINTLEAMLKSKPAGEVTE